MNKVLAERDELKAERDKALAERDESLVDFSKITKQMFEDGIETKLKYDSYFDEAKRVGIDREIEINKFLDEIMDYQVIALEKNLDIDNGLTELINKAKAFKEKINNSRHGVNRKRREELITYFENNKRKYESINQAAKYISEIVDLDSIVTVRHISEYIAKNIVEYYEKNIITLKDKNDESIAKIIYDTHLAHPLKLKDITNRINKHRKEKKHTPS
jgi:hypothetical protein